MSIAVTLNFPDQAALVAFFTGKAGPADTPPVVVVVEPAAKPVKPKAAAASTVAAAPAAAKPAADAVDYATLQRAVFELAGIVKGQGLSTDEHVLSLAKTFGFDNFKAMKDAGPAGAVYFSAALAAVAAKIDELATVA